MQAGSEKYGVPEVPSFTHLGRAGRPSASQRFNHSHDVSTQSISSSSAQLQQEQSSSTAAQHHLQQQLQQPARPLQHHTQTQQAQQQSTLPAAQRQQQFPQKSQAHRHNSQNDSPSHQVREVQQRPAGSDTPTPPSKAVDELNKEFKAAANKSLAVDDHDGLAEDAERACGGSRWPREETLALLKLRSDMDASFRDTNLKGPLWEEVSRKLVEMGYNRNAKKCKEKFENVQKYYRRTKDGKTGRHDGKTYRFFTQLEALHGSPNGNATPVEAMAKGTAQNEGLVAAPIETGPVSSLGDHEKGVPLLETRGDEMLGSTALPAPRHESDYSSGLNVSSESSDDEYESENPDNRKRKRKSPSQLFLCFFKNLVSEVLNKQEQMQKMLLDALERRESQRMIREEAWKRQEMARLTRDQELRAQERSMAARRDAALLAFLQRMTGQTFEFPFAAASIAILPGGGAAQGHGSEMVVKIHGEDENHTNEGDPNSKRWPKSEVELLIKLRCELQVKFIEPGTKGMLWKDISDAMAKVGFSRSAKRCKEKWENINKYFKKAKQSNRKRPENAKTCPYFDELDSLYRKGVLKSIPAQFSSPHTKLANGYLHPDQACHDYVLGPAPETASIAVAAAAASSVAIAADVSSTAHPQEITPSENFNGSKIFPVSSDDPILSSPSPSAPPTNQSINHQQTAQEKLAAKEVNALQPYLVDQSLAVAKDGDEHKMEVMQDETANQTQGS